MTSPAFSPSKLLQMLSWPVLAALVNGPLAQADVRLPRVFGSHMVLQREKPLPFWGWAAPGEKVTVRIGETQATTTATPAGEWKVTLPPQKAAGSIAVTVSGQNTVTFEDVWVGEVWLCSGQSNMEMGIVSCQDGAAEVAAANYPNIRLFMVPNRWTPVPQQDVEASWKVCSPQTVAEGGWGGFSAAAYYFGRELHQRLQVPVGLIDATWGGTRIEPWTPPEGFASVPALAQEYERVQLADPRSELHQNRTQEFLRKTEQWLADSRQALTRREVLPPMPTFPDELQPPRDVQHATALYNGMLHPLQPFALRGAIWYQGESNSSEGMLYVEHTQALVQGWRKVWGDESLAYYYVQIAPYDYDRNPEILAEFWEAQAAAQSIPGTGMIVINDIGNVKDIHPANKQEVGRRLARWALAKNYGLTDVAYANPALQAMSIEGNTVRLSFQNAQGLRTRDGKAPSWFEIIDAEEGGFEPAAARIDGESILLSSPNVPHPVAVRYAWHMLAEPNLSNGAGLPLGAFRSGNIPKRDLLALKVPEAKKYELVYDLDLAKLGDKITYDADRTTQIQRAFDRVGYFVELTRQNGDTQYLWVSMDAFTDQPAKLGIPTLASKIFWQQKVANLNVLSNVKGITTGQGLKEGNLEFWPNNYDTGNRAGIPQASAQVYDFGDSPAALEDGYGCMQVHNFGAGQTLFAINHWREGARADLGIGNQSSNNPDWTFSANASQYVAKRLRVLVKVK